MQLGEPSRVRACQVRAAKCALAQDALAECATAECATAECAIDERTIAECAIDERAIDERTLTATGLRTFATKMMRVGHLFRQLTIRVWGTSADTGCSNSRSGMRRRDWRVRHARSEAARGSAPVSAECGVFAWRTLELGGT